MHRGNPVPFQPRFEQKIEDIEVDANKHIDFTTNHLVTDVEEHLQQPRQFQDRVTKAVNRKAFDGIETIETLRAHCRDAKRKGARLLLGGERMAKRGNWFQPTVFDRVEDIREPVAGFLLRKLLAPHTRDPSRVLSHGPNAPPN